MWRQMVSRAAVALVIVWGCAAVGWAVLDAFGMHPETAGHQVIDGMDVAGVDHTVTAVLLNFRAYDTLLEIVVLTTAFWGAWSLRISRMKPREGISDLLLRRVAAMLVPVFLLLAGYLLWAGQHRPGGEFQAGAVLGAAGILALLAGRAVPGARRLVVRQSLVVAGAAVFVVVALSGWGLTGEMFGYRRGWEPVLMFAIELAATLSIGFILVALFAGSVSGLTGDIQLKPVGPGGLDAHDQVEYRTFDPSHDDGSQSGQGDGNGG